MIPMKAIHENHPFLNLFSENNISSGIQCSVVSVTI